MGDFLKQLQEIEQLYQTGNISEVASKLKQLLLQKNEGNSGGININVGDDLHVVGDIVGGDKTVINQIPEPIDDTARYLKLQQEQYNKLPLVELGLKSEASLTLADVFIALNATERGSRSGNLEAPVKLSINTPLNSDLLRKIIILGEPGSGKSSVVRHWLMNCAEKCQDPQKDVWPCFVTLRELYPFWSGSNFIDWEKWSETQRQERCVEGFLAYGQGKLQKYRGVLRQWEVALEEGRMWLVFDGLDEISEPGRERIQAGIMAISQAYPHLQKIVISCRTRSYTTGNYHYLLQHFREYELDQLNESQILGFVEKWYKSQHFSELETSQRVAEIKQAIKRTELFNIVETPLLLTMMVLIQQNQVRLPDQRVKLYKKVVELLLWQWQKHKEGIPPELEPLFRDEQRLWKLMQKVAFTLHTSQSNPANKTARLNQEQLRCLLRPECGGSLDTAEKLIEYFDLRAGLLMGYGGDNQTENPAEYDFAHRTFQEYLAGCYLLWQPNTVTALEKLAEKGEYWHVAVQLAVEELAYNEQYGQEKLWNTAQLLKPKGVKNQTEGWKLLWSSYITKLLGVSWVQQQEKRGKQYLTELRPQLAKISTGQKGKMAVLERVEAGRLLGEIGDPRPEVMTLEKMEFGYIPAGQFSMGRHYESSSLLNLPYDYYLSRFPVTNAQFDCFVQDKGYLNPEWWKIAEPVKLWKPHQGFQNSEDNCFRVAPYDYGKPFNFFNHPVVGLSWYEAIAFAKWLSYRWHHLLPQDWSVTLPSEAEWEKGAKGGVSQEEVTTCQLISAWLSPSTKPAPRQGIISNRSYPRVKKQQESVEYGNYLFTNINSSSAVGCFPLGKSQYGLEEMGGNVSEWTRSLYKEYPYDPYDGRELLNRTSQDITTVRGVSSSNHIQESCSIRSYDYPARFYNHIGFRVAIVPFNI